MYQHIKNILIIIDERFCINNIVNILNKNSFQIFKAPNFEKGLEISQKHKCDIIITKNRFLKDHDLLMIQKIRHTPSNSQVPILNLIDDSIDEKFKSKNEISIENIHYFESSMKPNILLVHIYHLLYSN